MRVATLLPSAGLAVMLGVLPAFATDYNCTQVRLIVPYGAAGATDVAARVVAERLEPALKRSVVIENRPGATGNIGTVAVINSPPDGCTLLVNSSVIATFVHSFPKLGYDPFKDLVPVGGIGFTPNVLVAAPSVPARDLKSLVQLAKDRPAGLSYSTSGYGLPQHLVVEELARRGGVKLVLIAYKSPPAMIADLIAGRLEFGSLLAGTTKGLIQQRQLNALAVVQDTRSSLLPDVPTTTEQRFPGLSGSVHFMLFAPAATPRPVVAMLDAELRKIISESAVKERLLGVGFEPTPMTSEEVSAAMRRTGEAFEPIIKRLDLNLQ
jgi:tripartite-type tricarboxylate transporter receptor subunit TctC